MAEQQHNLDQWPEILRQLATIVGPELALQLATEHGGPTWTYVPSSRSATKPHPWRSVITDPEMWKRITAEFGGMRVHLPRGVHVRLKKVEILELAEAGVSVPEIVRRVRVNERYVRRVLKAVAPEAAQPKPGSEAKKRRRRKKRRTWKATAEAVAKVTVPAKSRRRRRVRQKDPTQLELF